MKITIAPYKTREQAGDTIVEVLVALAVVSVILVGAFIVTNRSTKDVRDSEEHAQALQFLQGQVELLRSAASRSGALPASLDVPFCLDAAIYYQPAASDSNCLLDSLYRVAIVSPVASPGTGTTTFNLTATWPGINGGTGFINLSYNVAVTP
jgi:prepilin-type N-terminal cleavage/methylation domain-containing protein